MLLYINIWFRSVYVVTEKTPIIIKINKLRGCFDVFRHIFLIFPIEQLAFVGDDINALPGISVVLFQNSYF